MTGSKPDWEDATVKAEDGRGRSPGTFSLLVISGENVVSHQLRERGVMTVGRSRSADIPIQDPAISRKHFTLHLGIKVTVKDLGSTNGIRVRGRKLAPRESAELEPGDVIEVQSVTMLLQRGTLAERPVRPPTAAEPPTMEPVVTSVGSMGPLWQFVGRIAASPLSVLLLGETGVGKEVFAEALHRLSPRAYAPFVRINCAALSATLLDSELFGYERGAFTGAVTSKVGLLETAQGGTLFLDEVGEMSPEIQAKLLLVIEERRVRRLGGLKAQPIDVRFVSATNVDLQRAIAQQRFRGDLFFRLNGVSLVVPPLRERRLEIEALALAFLRNMSRQMGRREPTLSSEALRALIAHDWPGNIRELRNVVERAVVLCGDEPIGVEHLRIEKLDGSEARPARDSGESLNAADAERQLILDALKRAGGNQTKAAKLLGISRGTLIKRLAAFCIRRPRKSTDG